MKWTSPIPSGSRSASNSARSASLSPFLNPSSLTANLPPFLFKRLRTLPFSVFRKSCICHSYENSRGAYQLFPFWNASLLDFDLLSPFSFHALTNCPSRISFPFTSIQMPGGVWGAASHFLPRSIFKNLTPVFSHSSKLLCAFLHFRKVQFSYFQAIPNSSTKNLGDGGQD